MAHAHRLSATLLVTAVAAAWLMAAEAPATEGRVIRHSDVVFMYDNPKVYETYGCTVLGWAGWGNAPHIQAAHEKGVRLFASSIGFITESAGVIDFCEKLPPDALAGLPAGTDPAFLDAACRNFEGKPFITPWLWDHKHKGHPSYWWCTNSPLYRRYLHHRLERTMAARPDGLHIDDYRGTSGCVTWLAGGFCRHCLAAFRDYLTQNVPKDKLATLGITDLAKFDYRQFLLGRDVTAADYQKRRTSLPLAAEFLDFHVKAATAFVAEFRQRAGQLRGQPVPLAVNSCPSDPQSLAIGPHLSYFCCEVGHAADKREPATHPVFPYKLADALDRPITSTAGGHDWAFVHQHKIYGLVRSWIALSYALGHNFMVPHHQWCYTQEKGTHWTDFPTDAFAPLYRFVHGSARLLDGYEAVAPVAVVYSNAANRRYKGRIEAICVALAQANVPFAAVIAGDDWLPQRLTTAQLAPFQAVVVPKDATFDADQQKALDQVAAQKRLVPWPDAENRLAQLVRAPRLIEGADQVWVHPRALPGNPQAPVAIHLLNRRYDKEKDAMLPQRSFGVSLPRNLFGGRGFSRAVLHAPGTAAREVKLVADAQQVTVAVPELDLWAILELIP